MTAHETDYASAIDARDGDLIKFQLFFQNRSAKVLRGLKLDVKLPDAPGPQAIIKAELTAPGLEEHVEAVTVHPIDNNDIRISSVDDSGTERAWFAHGSDRDPIEFPVPDDYLAPEGLSLASVPNFDDRDAGTLSFILRVHTS